MKKSVALLLVCLLLLLLLAACGEKEKPKLSELSDEDMMAYLKEKGVRSYYDIYGEQLHEAAEALRKKVKMFEDDPKGAFFFAGTQMFSGVVQFPCVHILDVVTAVNGYYGLDGFGNPMGEREKYDSYEEYFQKVNEEFMARIEEHMSSLTENAETFD